MQTGCLGAGLLFSLTEGKKKLRHVQEIEEEGEESMEQNTEEKQQNLFIQVLLIEVDREALV